GQRAGLGLIRTALTRQLQGRAVKRFTALLNIQGRGRYQQIDLIRPLLGVQPREQLTNRVPGTAHFPVSCDPRTTQPKPPCSSGGRCYADCAPATTAFQSAGNILRRWSARVSASPFTTSASCPSPIPRMPASVPARRSSTRPVSASLP